MLIFVWQMTEFAEIQAALQNLKWGTVTDALGHGPQIASHAAKSLLTINRGGKLR